MEVVEPPPKGGPPSSSAAATLGSVGEDVLQDILSKLPAPSFAAAACVSHSWNRVCNRILTRPKLLSALSLNPSLQEAVNEALDKALAEPIRPHFAIASVGRKFSLTETHKLIKSKLGSGIPIIVSEAAGFIGKDARTNQYKEVKWEENENNIEPYNSLENRYRGIILTVGFVPGLKVCAIPLTKETKEPSKMSTIDKFITDIKDYTTSVSGSKAPVGIMMFADPDADMKPVLEKMDYAISRDTIIIGDESGSSLCNIGVDDMMIFARKQRGYKFSNADAIALVFASDPQGIGEVHFSLALSTGVSPVGPIYKGVSVRVVKDYESKSSTWLTAKREGSNEKLDGETILQDIENLIEYDPLDNDLYIGVAKRRKCHIGSEKGKLVSSFSFHEVARGDESYLYVVGEGIKTGDTFQFFHPDSDLALTSRNDVFENFRTVKQSYGDEKIVCGGMMFSCYGRGESFVGRPHADSSAFLENFPDVPLSGVFCFGEIARGSLGSIGLQSGDERPSNCHLHVYSTAYLLIVHTL